MISSKAISLLTKAEVALQVKALTHSNWFLKSYMESGSRTDNPPGQTPHRLANIFGTLIALMTLTIPVFAIAYFSSNSVEVWQPPVYPLVRSGD